MKELDVTEFLVGLSVDMRVETLARFAEERADQRYAFALGSDSGKRTVVLTPVNEGVRWGTARPKGKGNNLRVISRIQTKRTRVQGLKQRTLRWGYVRPERAWEDERGCIYFLLPETLPSTRGDGMPRGKRTAGPRTAPPGTASLLAKQIKEISESPAARTQPEPSAQLAAPDTPLPDLVRKLNDYKRAMGGEIQFSVAPDETLVVTQSFR